MAIKKHTLHVVLKLTRRPNEVVVPYLRQLIDMQNSRIIPLLPVPGSKDLYMATILVSLGWKILHGVLIGHDRMYQDRINHFVKLQKDSYAYIVWGEETESTFSEFENKVIFPGLEEEKVHMGPQLFDGVEALDLDSMPASAAPWVALYGKYRDVNEAGGDCDAGEDKEVYDESESDEDADVDEDEDDLLIEEDSVPHDDCSFSDFPCASSDVSSDDVSVKVKTNWLKRAFNFVKKQVTCFSPKVHDE